MLPRKGVKPIVFQSFLFIFFIYCSALYRFIGCVHQVNIDYKPAYTYLTLSRIKFKKSRENYLKTKISHRPFRGCGSGSQIGSDRKFRKSQISISKQMYRTITLLMEKINISSLDFYFGELARIFHFAKNSRIKAERSPQRTQGF